VEITLLKIFLTPVLVLLVYLLQKKWGATVGGLFLGLPIIIAPFLIIVYLQESHNFFKGAIHGVFLGQIVLLIFTYSYARLATKLSWYITIGLVTLITFSSSIVLQYLNLSFPSTIIITFVLYVVLRIAWPKPPTESHWQESNRWELPFRLLVTPLTVFVLTTFSHFFGPKVSGALSTYPIILTFLGSLSHRQGGPSHILKTIQGLIYSLPISYAIFMALVVLT
jgi:hypothetical protein